MTEQEIINVLKENKTKGVAYTFMPEDVRDWVHDHFKEPKLLYLAPYGKWDLFCEADDFDDYDNVVFALPDDYEPKKEKQGEWISFEIDSKGEFDIGTDSYKWFEWQRAMLEHNSKAFGGWQYSEDNNLWFMTPQIYDSVAEKFLAWACVGVDSHKPAIPVKIRFWRENK